MIKPLLSLPIEGETDIIEARQRTRLIASLAGFDAQTQTRITTAVSEIVRNVLEYAAKGEVAYRLIESHPQSLEIAVSDQGPGMPDVAAILDGSHRSQHGLGVGITGARRLMDEFELSSELGRGTKVVMRKMLPKNGPPVNGQDLARQIGASAGRSERTMLSEIRRQNHELMVHFQELQKRQEELEQVNQELEDTNRGVVALYAELDERADHLRRADQLKSRFLSNMSHEFRTPLNSILSLSRLLLARTDGELSAEQEKQVHFIRKAAETLTELINDLLDLAKVEAGKTVVTPRQFAVNELFGTLRGMLKPLLVSESVALVFEDCQDVPPILSDEGKVSQILRNFISNALKYTDRGEVRVWASWDRDNDRVSFFVRDTGIGIAAEDLSLIWEEFHQIPNTMQGKVKGTGLGLPLSKKLGDLLDGEVGVESALGEGSVFRLTLPRRMGLQSETSPPPEWIPEPGRLPVLVVEDNQADSFTLERALAHSRYQPISVRNTGDARQLLTQVTPAAILLDLLLEHEESWQFLLELRQREQSQHVPIVVISTLEEERKARSFGASAYLSKPVNPGLLVRTIDAITGAQSVRNVLLVDDEEVSRYLIRQLLPRGAFDLQEASGFSEGLALARREQPDVILLDLSMPDHDGFEFLDRMVGDANLAAVPTIVLTSMLLTETQRARLKSATVISKFDLTTDVLVSAIDGATGAAAS